MSFNFGNTSNSLFPATSNTSAFGSAAAKPTGFGTPFGATTTSAPPAFGLGTGTATTSSGFGGFGTTPAGTTGFGALGGFGGAAAGTTSTGFGFGNATSTPATGGFGAATSTPSTGFGAFGTFGTPAATTTASTGFNFGSSFSFGAPTTTTTATSFGGFGSLGTSTTGATGTSLFGGGLTQPGGATGFGSFGNFAQKPATGFGLGAFGQQQQQQQPIQPQPTDPSLALYNSIFNCQIFGDERDVIIGRWNLMQALWGAGKGFYSQHAPPVEYDLKNPFCRFKAIAYSVRPRHENRDGLVALIFNKKDTEVRSLESQIVTNLVNILGNKPNLAPAIDSIRAMSDAKTLVVIYVQEKTATGSVRKIPANELTAFLLQPMPKQQLTGLQVENVFPQVEVPAEQLREYLDTPPAGVDAEVWQQAQADNPMPDRLIPVPLVGFAEIRWRLKCQETEAGLQQAFLAKISEEFAELQRKQVATVANITEYKSRLVELQHRILKVIILQEKSRKMGMSLLPEEEVLNSRLEALSSSLNSSSFKNRLTQLTDGVKSLTDSNKEPQRYKMDANVVADIKQFLSMEQTGMTHVIETIQSDLAELKIIKDGMMRLLQAHV